MGCFRKPLPLEIPLPHYYTVLNSGLSPNFHSMAHDSTPFPIWSPLAPPLEPAGDKNGLVCSKGLPANQQRDVSEDPAQAQLIQIAEHVGGVAGEFADIAERSV